MNVRKLQKEFFFALIAVCISLLSLCSSTYAWFVANTTVKATSSTISAKANGFALQIANADQGAQHGGNQTSLAASTVGGRITPSSTNDLKDWYICQGWNSEGKVNTYQKITVSEKGAYSDKGSTRHAFIRSDYIVYTITESGLADIYLDASEGAPITVALDNGKTASSSTIPDSMRIAITTQALDTDGKTPKGDETLRVVYAPKAVTGSGNDAQAIDDKWTYINVDQPDEVTYPHIHEITYKDQYNKNWAATKSGDDYTVEEGSEAIATNVGYNGILVHVYIWMEGTDADCVNNEATQDEATYSVTVKLAGVAAGT